MVAKTIRALLSSFSRVRMRTCCSISIRLSWPTDLALRSTLDSCSIFLAAAFLAAFTNNCERIGAGWGGKCRCQDSSCQQDSILPAGCTLVASDTVFAALSRFACVALKRSAT